MTQPMNKNLTSSINGDGDGETKFNQKNYISNAAQTDLSCDDVEKLVQFKCKYFEKQLEIDVDLR
jgi:hypothetical protein